MALDYNARITCVPVIMVYAVALCIEAFMFNKLNISSDAICEDLNPIHIMPNAIDEPQYDDCPFNVTSNTSIIELGWSSILTVRSLTDIKFKGFILQARYRDLPCGRFEPQPDLTVITCKGKGPVTKDYDLTNISSHLAIHFDGKPKTSYALTWHAPNYVLGVVGFYLSVIVDTSTYWVAAEIEDGATIMFSYKYHEDFFTEKPKEKGQVEEDVDFISSITSASGPYVVA